MKELPCQNESFVEGVTQVNQKALLHENVEILTIKKGLLRKSGNFYFQK